MAHKVFIAFLLFIGFTAAIAIGVRGVSYYSTPLQERPFRNDYEEMKPSSSYGIGLGAIGASMVTIGVVTYSTRKRVRALWNVGQLSGWLEFHIFLCLLGPVLVVYHTTFKAGGVAAISLWSMLSVAASGIVGRFLYALIPHNVKGHELTAVQINDELSRLGQELSSNPIGEELINMIDQKFAAIPSPKNLAGVISTLVKLQSAKRDVRNSIRAMLTRSLLPHDRAEHLFTIAAERTSLRQKSVVLGQIGRMFYYWHAIHLPFTVIMFITLVLHVIVVTMLGYSWHF
jgi:hypothetical protein